MARRLNLGAHFDAFIDAQLASGRYGDAEEIVRDGLRLLENRERRANALAAALHEGLADAQAGRLHEADAVFDELLVDLADAPNFAAE